ncbi:fibronectin type III domain-containing protein [Sporosarcina sp. P17b]|uniref:fibronectin type III domain-containing protein n=1 Tax=Sporosarcina sp. P17b TaxID=2048260 RepID=UPI000C1639DD|nr:fibronectin type III domain-containing protein [Sporosarcina sp. P17b]PIC73353.1 hypothetical protein CSV76_11085 [Sporosarcina sp. P17b]
MEKLPLWLKQGIEPSLQEKNGGWSPGNRPPAQFLNWYMNQTYLILKEHSDHKKRSVNSETGAHDFKYAGNTIYGFVNGEWIDVFHEEVIVVPDPNPDPEGPIESVPEEPLSPVRGISISTTSRTATVKWTNPTDENFYAVIVRYREGSILPTSLTDGILAYEGSSDTITVHNLKPETWYSFRIFTISISGKVNSDHAYQTVRGKTLREVVIHGVRIDTTNSNPETAVTYIEDSMSSTPAKGSNGNFNYGSWKERFPFNQIKPCLMKGDTVLGYLDPNNFKRFKDGTSAEQTITLNYDKPNYPYEINGNVMIEFPKIYWKIERSGNYIYVRYSDVQYDSTYQALAHTRGKKVQDKVYLAAFLGSKQKALNNASDVADKELWSITMNSVALLSNQTLGNLRTMAQNNGPNYDIMGFHQLTMLQVLFLIMFKNRDSQAALGKGYTGLTINDKGTTTGNTYNKGMYYGSDNYLEQVKFCGMEDIWGNYAERIDGFYIDVNGQLLIGTTNFNDAGLGYTNYGKIEKGGFFPKDVRASTGEGFIPNVSGGSSTTHYPDYGGVNYYDSSVMHGGDYRDKDSAGLFHTHISLPPGATLSSQYYGSGIGAGRLMYLEK